MAQAALLFIQQEYARRKEKNPRYSVRSFAQVLGLSSSALAQILKETRKLTFATTRQILDRLQVSEPLRSSLLLDFDSDEPRTFVAPVTASRVLSEAELAVMAGWQFYAVLSLLELDKQKFSDQDIASRLNCSLDLIRSTITVLIDQGLVTAEASRYVATGATLTTSHRLPSPALLKAHSDYFAKAADALIDDAMRKRSDFSGITMAIAKEKIPEASRRIREFRRTLAAYLASGEKDEVYRINIQLFPLTR